MLRIFFLFSLLLCTVVCTGQKPVAQLPLTYIDTTFNLPTGVTWAAHTSTDLSNALKSSVPGDTIVLDAGVTYRGNFTLPAKANPNSKWIYIVSSKLSNLPAPGNRVSPANAANMPKIVAATGNYVFNVGAGANHYRLVGLEITSPAASITELIASGANIGKPMPDSITVDRCYLHGSDTTDVRRAVDLNASNYAVIDSYISNIHQAGNDSQAVGGWYTPGPIKIVNSHLEAASENIMFGGAGGLNNPWVPSDIEIRNNHIFKPLTWVAKSYPNGSEMVIKNLLELKSARRVLIDHNVLENIWPSAQSGYAFQLTPRPNQSGLLAVVDDVTITNNVLKNVSSGFDILESDTNCLPANGCTNPGELKRVVIANNLIMLGDTTQLQYNRGGAGGFLLLPGYQHAPLSDVVLQHNTIVPPPNLGYCKSSFYIDVGGTAPFTNVYSRTKNVWILDNVGCRQINGEAGWVGQFPYVLTDFLGDPPPPAGRLQGNVFYQATGDVAYPLPARNVVSRTMTFASDYSLTSPDWKAKTSDGKQVGVDASKLPGSLTTPPVVVTSITVSPTDATTIVNGTVQFYAMAFYSDGSKQMVTSSATWASVSGPNTLQAAAITAGGLATGKYPWGSHGNGVLWRPYCLNQVDRPGAVMNRLELGFCTFP